MILNLRGALTVVSPATCRSQQRAVWLASWLFLTPASRIGVLAKLLDKLVPAYTSVMGLLCISVLKFQFKGDCMALIAASDQRG